ncbi:MAG: prephenate/arogenate dehydrogenase family protein [Alphaproteobacteria bacterium]
MSAVLYDKIALIGLGLIGASIALAAREQKLVKEIVGYTRRPETRAIAKSLNIADTYPESAAAAVEGADLVVLATPVGSFADLAREIGQRLKPGSTLTDVGGVKTAVVRDVGPHVPPGVHFVPGHPIAGTENSGPAAGFSTLFQGRWCILTPARDAEEAAVQKLEAFWRALGSSVEKMTPEHHDLVLAITSHVPHLIAYNIVKTAADLEKVTSSEVIKYSAGGFRDFTRIAASDPVMWRDIFLNNKEAVLEMLGRFNEDLTALQRAVRWGDGETLEKVFTRTRAIRRQVIEAGQETAEPDFGRHSKDSPKK